MPLTPEQRLELLEKARAVKASKKIERDKLKPKPVKGRPKKTLNLDDVASETNVEELAEDIKNMEVKQVEEPTIETELPQQNEEEDNVEIVEEVVKKPKKKKKIIRRFIEPSSSSDEEIVEEYIKAKKKPKQPKAPILSSRYEPYNPEPEPVRLTPPALNLFCY
jgi:hypothetical protein